MGSENEKAKKVNYNYTHHIINIFKKLQMPARLEEKVIKLFSMIDVDDSKTIDREETLKFWSKGFAKINSKVLFEQVDKNNDGAIQLEEWLEFWRVVYESGYDEDEICAELDNMINGGSWVKFDTNTKLNKERDKQLKKKGKW